MNARKRNFDTTQTYRSREDIAQIMVMAWWHLHNRDLPCGPQALATHVRGLEPAFPMPSVRTISRMLVENEVPNDNYYRRVTSQ